LKLRHAIVVIILCSHFKEKLCFQEDTP